MGRRGEEEGREATLLTKATVLGKRSVTPEPRRLPMLLSESSTSRLKNGWCRGAKAWRALCRGWDSQTHQEIRGTPLPQARPTLVAKSPAGRSGISRAVTWGPA